MNEDQDSALRRLHDLLTQAIDSGALASPVSDVLRSVNILNGESMGIIDFFYILRQASVEARKITKPASVNAYIPELDRLQEFVLENDVYKTAWSDFINRINTRNTMPIIDALANYYSSEHPSMSLKEDFLKSLLDELNIILQEATDSDLPRELKRVISSSLNGIIQSIHKYNIDGTDGIRRAVQALIAELLIFESTSIESKPIQTNNVLRKASIIGCLLLSLLRPSIYDIIGAVPDIKSFWIPAIQQLYEDNVNQDVEFPSLQELLKLSDEQLHKQCQNSLPGAAIPKGLLPQGKDPP
jgi:hypothetical protein